MCTEIQVFIVTGLNNEYKLLSLLWFEKKNDPQTVRPY